METAQSTTNATRDTCGTAAARRVGFSLYLKKKNFYQTINEDIKYFSYFGYGVYLKLNFFKHTNNSFNFSISS